ncbi:hypothetical protein F5148DRAFT_1211064 [Russula earlei]|uniref:Uncharacterized protein n=1 Tax=Russula earlei TaxID=71964 RepID=A0ACC0U6G6_9AGAM|nr:hypothetical protein F5148DRAFT_1211064 [Russula earlei]
MKYTGTNRGAVHHLCLVNKVRDEQRKKIVGCVGMDALGSANSDSAGKSKAACVIHQQPTPFPVSFISVSHPVRIAMSEPEDSKPKLNLIISHSGTQVTVKVKANMQFKKIFEVAEKRFGKDPGTLRFVYDGERLSPTETPAEKSMEDGDVIDALLQQVGGGSHLHSCS